MLQAAQNAEELIDDLAGRVQVCKVQIEGDIKLTILAPFTRLHMEPVAMFRTTNPNCRVTINATEDLARLEYGEAHIALRAGAKPGHPDYVVKRFEDVTFNLQAHENYISRFGLPYGADDLDGCKFVIPYAPEAHLPFRPWINDHVRDDMIALSSWGVWVNIEAISAGIGMGFIADHEAEACKDIHPVLPLDDARSVSLWLVTHVDLHRTEKVQAMLQCIRTARGKG